MAGPRDSTASTFFQYELPQILSDKRRAALAIGVTMVFCITADGNTLEGEWYADLRANPPIAGVGVPRNAEITFKMSNATFLEVLATPNLADERIASGKIVVTGDVSKAVALQQFLALK